MSNRISRRRFLHGVAGTVGAAAVVGPYILRAAEPNKEKLRIVFIGTGGQAHAHHHLAQSEQCVAYCDVDKNQWVDISKLAPNVPSYTDYRVMLEKHEKEIDAVVVTTPDHSHAPASMLAIKMGKHVYCEKPLTWSIQEARAIAEAATQYKVATQMGNAGHANQGNRRVVEWVRAGAIGDVVEVHTWTNRPVWPQGIAKRPPIQPVPADLDWDCWIGPAPLRDYHKGLHRFDWRGWFDFGCGAVGDMGCHTWDCVYWSMQPDYPSYVELMKIEGRCQETFPRRCAFKWVFPAKGNRPGFEAYWYEGGLKPPVPDELLNDPARKDPKNPDKKPSLPDSGSLFVGTKGKLLVAGDYGESPRLIPESFMQEYTRPPQLPRSPGHKEEWLMACKGEKPLDFPGSNFPGYAGPLTEVMLLGAITQRIGEVGFRLECDPVKRQIKTKEALAYFGREYRKGWTL